MLIVAWAVILLPAFPLSLMWLRVCRFTELLRGLVLVSALGATISFSFFLVSIENEYLLGSHYGTRRFTTIGLNLGLMAAGTLLSMSRKGPLQSGLFWSCLLVGLAWLYALAVGSAA